MDRPRIRGISYDDLVTLPRIDDDRGSLSFLEYGEDICSLPFVVRRIYFMYDIYARAVRGGHAHRTQDTLLIVPSGKVDVRIHDASGDRTYRMDNPRYALRVRPMAWRDLTGFTPSTVVIALASTAYDAGDYIRNYDQFLREIHPSVSASR